MTYLDRCCASGQCECYIHKTDTVRNEARSRNFCCHGKPIRITYSECVSVALVMQHAMRMRRTLLPPVGCPAVSYLSTLSHKQHDFSRKVAEHKTVVCLSVRITQPDAIITLQTAACKEPVVIARLQRHLNVLERVSKILKYEIL